MFVSDQAKCPRNTSSTTRGPSVQDAMKAFLMTRNLTNWRASHKHQSRMLRYGCDYDSFK